MGFPRPIRRRVAPADGNGGPQTFDGQVGASSDDGKQATDDSVSLTAQTPLSDNVAEHIGLRWTSVTIPAGATIDLAQVGVFISFTGADEPKHQIRGEFAGNPGTFTTTSDDIDSRTRTTASVQWNSANLGAAQGAEWEWGATVVGEGNGVDLSAIVQEITDNGGWASGNAMVMIFEQHTATDSARDLGIRNYDFIGNAHGSKLHVEFTA